MILWKWDFRRHEYLPFGVPNDRKVGIWSADLSDRVDCANCGRLITYGESLVSLTIHTHTGIGFAVCRACQNEEIKEKLEAEEELGMTREEAAAMLQEEIESNTKSWENIGVKMPGILQTANEAKSIAVSALLENNWCDAELELPPEGELVLALAKAQIGAVHLRNSYELACYYPEEGIWELEMYPDCEDAQVRWWMPLPEAPQEAE